MTDEEVLETIPLKPYKQVIVMRKDLNMRKGKMIAQGSHASLGVVIQEFNEGESYLTKPPVYDENGECILNLVLKKGSPLAEWLEGAYRKITVYVNSEAELLEVFAEATKAGLPVKLITDNGLTEFDGKKTLTCLAIGPCHNDDVDPITGHLPLL